MDAFEKLYAITLRFLSLRPRSEKEIRNFLVRKKATQETIDRILHALLSKNLLNDQEFALWWIEQRMRFRPRGKRALHLELLQKGVPRDVIQHALEKQSAVSETSMAIDLVKKKGKRFFMLPKIARLKKLQNLLARNGFDYEIIKEAIDEIEKREVY